MLSILIFQSVSKIISSKQVVQAETARMPAAEYYMQTVILNKTDIYWMPGYSGLKKSNQCGNVLQQMQLKHQKYKIH